MRLAGGTRIDTRLQCMISGFLSALAGVITARMGVDPITGERHGTGRHCGSRG